MLLARLARALFDPGLPGSRRPCQQGPAPVRGRGRSRGPGPLAPHRRPAGQRYRADADPVRRQAARRRAGLSRRRLGPVGPAPAARCAARAARLADGIRAARASTTAGARRRPREPERADGRRARPGSARRARGRVATYPEWDRAAGSERPDWTTVREVEPRRDPAEAVEEMLAPRSRPAAGGSSASCAPPASGGRPGCAASRTGSISTSTPPSTPPRPCGSARCPTSGSTSARCCARATWPSRC